MDLVLGIWYELFSANRRIYVNELIVLFGAVCLKVRKEILLTSIANDSCGFMYVKFSCLLLWVCYAGILSLPCGLTNRSHPAIIPPHQLKKEVPQSWQQEVLINLDQCSWRSMQMVHFQNERGLQHFPLPLGFPQKILFLVQMVTKGIAENLTSTTAIIVCQKNHVEGHLFILWNTISFDFRSFACHFQMSILRMIMFKTV